MAIASLNTKIPEKWGTSAAAFFARHEAERLNIHLLSDAKVVSGILVGVDRYDIFVERDDGVVVLICKHAIQHIEPTSY